MTHRQFLVWRLWLREEWNRPNRTDHYIMQIAEACNLSGERLKWPLTFTFNVQVTTPEVEHQFEELKEQGYSVPRRMTKEDIAKYQRLLRHSELSNVKVQLRPPRARQHERD